MYLHEEVVITDIPCQTKQKYIKKLTQGLLSRLGTPKNFVVEIKASVVTNGVAVVSTTAVGSIVAVIAKITIIVIMHNHGHNIRQKKRQHHDERKLNY